MNIGSSNRLRYDNCEYQKSLFESTSPLLYHLYEGYGENCHKCIYDKFWRKFDLVDVESELFNITRPNSKCDQFKYDPKCKKTPNGVACMTTYDKDVPVVPDSSVCPIVHNNIPKMSNPGFTVPSTFPCKRVTMGRK